MGLLKITPKDKNGKVITDFEDHIIHDQNGAEVKEWYALASYLESCLLYTSGNLKRVGEGKRFERNIHHEKGGVG